ncbi:L-asparaginase [Hydromonas duriensis]|uniref:L-asparaginase n=2 Tax=Hydromonas duriensis TaxID=1527608 RepID=A0A4R6YAI8_9BURK|nr:L-asparaginase [Hydromonas duriensis]
MRTNAEGLLVPAVSGDELTASIPALKEIAEISSTQVSNLPSAQMSPNKTLELRQHIIDTLTDESIAGIVIVHGTDTLEETAFLLDASLGDNQLHNKPVVLTGAMRSNDQLSSDGMANLLAAVRVTSDDDSLKRGVMVCLNQEIHSARYVRKMDTSSLHTFCSPQFTALGRISHNQTVQYLVPAQRFTPHIDVSRETSELPRVDIINMYAGADASLLHASIKLGAQAIVVQAVGASSVNLELYDGIVQAIEQGVAVVIASRSPLGLCEPVYGYKGGGQTLAELGTCFAHDLPAHKARLYTQLLLSRSQHNNDDAIDHIQKGFQQLKLPH